jgi:hypothetical protein
MSDFLTAAHLIFGAPFIAGLAFLVTVAVAWGGPRRAEGAAAWVSQSASSASARRDGGCPRAPSTSGGRAGGGNPFTVMNGHRQGWLVWDDRDRFGFVNFETSNGFVQAFPTREEAQRDAVRRFRRFMFRQWDLTPLAGRDLACWCPLDQPCHADVLLEVANR